MNIGRSFVVTNYDSQPSATEATNDAYVANLEEIILQLCQVFQNVLWSFAEQSKPSVYYHISRVKELTNELKFQKINFVAHDNLCNKLDTWLEEMSARLQKSLQTKHLRKNYDSVVNLSSTPLPSIEERFEDKPKQEYIQRIKRVKNNRCKISRSYVTSSSRNQPLYYRPLNTNSPIQSVECYRRKTDLYEQLTKLKNKELHKRPTHKLMQSERHNSNKIGTSLRYQIDKLL